ncbi:MAG TPA: hypothetical protein VF783_11760 [Terriglobales bacterium]
MNIAEIQGKKTFLLRALAPKSVQRTSIMEQMKTIAFQVEKRDGSMEYLGAFRDSESGYEDLDIYMATYVGHEQDMVSLPRLGRVHEGKFEPL